MQLFNVPWISHDGGSIFSLDMHPSGSKLVTAGQDGAGAGLLIVWDIEFIGATTLNNQSSAPEINYSPLARIPHTSSINCVRWSKQSGGGCIACAGDDPVLVVYECTGVYSSLGSINQPSTSNGCSANVRRNVESYRCTHKLFGHTLDVLHLDWSPDGKYLASCSLDNSIIIWNALKLTEKIIVLKESNGGHARGVKGLAWDPVGRFLSTQAEDNMLKIWQTDSWVCVRTFADPFSESAISTLFCRMDWSPDGCYLVAPCAMNNGGPTAKIFVRKDWTFKRDLVGFRKAVACVRANPNCFQRTNSSGTHSTVSCFAIGSRDRSVSVWLIPNFGRPLLVMERLFKDSVVDLSWSKLTLASCSRDGVVRIMKFFDTEIGHMLSTHETGQILERLYGVRICNSQDRNERNHSGFSTDFGYTSICQALTKRARETTISENELYRIAFNRDLPRKRVSDKFLHHFAQTAKKQRITEQQHILATNILGHTNTAAGELQRHDEISHFEVKQLTDNRLYERRGSNELETMCAFSNQSDQPLFELPETKRLLVAMLANTETEKLNSLTADINFIEVINNYPMESCKECEIARTAAYRAGECKPAWLFYCSRIISILTANRQWTVLTTFDAHFIALYSSTGRLSFEVCLDELLVVMQLEGDLCLSLGHSGTIAICNIANGGRILLKHTVRSLLKDPNHQLISTFMSKLPDQGNAYIRLLLSEYSMYTFAPKISAWLKNGSIVDLFKAADIPTNITSMILRD